MLEFKSEMKYEILLKKQYKATKITFSNRNRYRFCEFVHHFYDFSKLDRCQNNYFETDSGIKRSKRRTPRRALGSSRYQCGCSPRARPTRTQYELLDFSVFNLMNIDFKRVFTKSECKMLNLSLNRSELRARSRT